MDTENYYLEIALAAEVTAPVRIQITPRAGKITARDGRVMEFAPLEEIIKASPKEIHIDFDHGTDKYGGSSKAAGWVRNLKAESSGIWGDVEWTEVGKKSVEDKEFRGLSPTLTGEEVLDYEGRKDKFIVRKIKRIALTNNPALSLKELFTTQQETTMTDKQPVTAAVEQTELLTLQKQVELLEKENLALREAEKKAEEAKLKEEKHALKAQVEASCAEGKVLPTEKATYLGWLEKEGGSEYVTEILASKSEKLAIFAPLSTPTGGGKTETLSDADLEIVEKFGLDEKEYSKTKGEQNVS